MTKNVDVNLKMLRGQIVLKNPFMGAFKQKSSKTTAVAHLQLGASLSWSLTLSEQQEKETDKFRVRGLVWWNGGWMKGSSGRKQGLAKDSWGRSWKWGYACTVNGFWAGAWGLWAWEHWASEAGRPTPLSSQKVVPITGSSLEIQRLQPRSIYQKLHFIKNRPPPTHTHLCAL